jgi:cyclohexyl-isocyanide hydratase
MRWDTTGERAGAIVTDGPAMAARLGVYSWIEEIAMTNALIAPKPFVIVFVLFDNVTQLDFTGPAQFLSRLPGAQMHVAAATIDPVMTDCGFAILPTTSFADCPAADLLCVPGGIGVTAALGDAALIDFVARQGAAATWVTSVCTGAFILGRAGLLTGKRATTHWGYTQLLGRFGTDYVAQRVVTDGNIITAGGVTSGIDFALTVIAAVAGENVAKSVQLSLEYDPAPPFAGGTPVTSDPAIVAGMRSRFYDGAAQRMAAALDAAA